MKKKLSLLLLLLGILPLWTRAQQDSCSINTLPYSEDFSSYPLGTLTYIDSCWSSLYYTSYDVPTIVMQGIGGGKCLQLAGDFGTYDYNIGIMPPLADSINPSELMVTFYLKTSTLTNGLFEVGVMTDPTNISTFVPLSTVQNFTTTAFYPHHVYLNNYSDTGRYIAFRWTVYESPFTTYYAWVDDIIVETNPGCAMVENLMVGDITGTSALLRWDAGDFGTVSSYTIEYLNPDSTLTNIFGWVEDHFVMSGLEPNTPYTVYVTADCQEGTISNPDSISFTTGCASGGDILFGDGDHITSRNFHIHKYALSEEIYTASEIGGARNLQSISLHCTSANSNSNIAL